jgi:hypothetical protein
MAGSKMIIFGGWDGEKALSDLHVLDTGTTPPPDCLLHSSAELTSMRVAGRVRVRVRVRVRSCRAEKWVWEKVKTSGCMPQARYGHSAAYMRHDHPTLVPDALSSCQKSHSRRVCVCVCGAACHVR